MSKAKILTWENPELPWVRVFIEIALRALTDLHHRYLRNSYNQQTGKEPDFSKLNDGLGIADTDEITVCAAIYQEFISSRFTSGVYFQSVPTINVRAGEHGWDIKLFPPYPDKHKREKADFYVERIDTRTGKILEGTIPTMIEAKRAYLPYLDKDKNQITEIKKDIKKLRTNCGDELRGHILVWGIATNTNQGPYNYLAGLNIDKPDIVLQGARQIPLYVSKNFESVNSVEIDRWLWVTLGEVTKLHPGDPAPTGYSDC